MTTTMVKRAALALGMLVLAVSVGAGEATAATANGPNGAPTTAAGTELFFHSVWADKAQCKVRGEAGMANGQWEGYGCFDSNLDPVYRVALFVTHYGSPLSG